MTSTDPTRLTSGADIARTLLWLLLVISALGNMAASFADSGLAVHLACGSVTTLSATALAVRWLRGRR